MRKGGRYLMLGVVGLLLIQACKPKDPPQYIQPDEMEDILYDWHLAQGMASSTVGGNSYDSHLYYEAVLKKHHVTQAEFDSSLHYYYYRSDRFIDIYKRVQERLGEEALVLGASSSEVERYITQSASGDTTDLWEDSRRRMLIPNRPYNYMQFHLKGDTSYRAGDSFLMTFTNTFLVQNNMKNAEAYLAVTYMNDSTVTRNQMVSGNGSTMLRIASCKERVKDIRGYICVAQRQDNYSNPNDMCMLFLDRIRLIRFHKKEGDTIQTQAVPDESMKLSDPVMDTVKADSSGRRARRLGERPHKRDSVDKKASLRLIKSIQKNNKKKNNR